MQLERLTWSKCNYYLDLHCVVNSVRPTIHNNSLFGGTYNMAMGRLDSIQRTGSWSFPKISQDMFL